MNYENLEIDFIERTVKVIEQYESYIKATTGVEEFDVTLYMNSMTGILLLPRETGFLENFLPNERIEKWGLSRASIHPSINTIKELTKSLRHCIAHFDAEFIADSSEKMYKVKFKDKQRRIEIAEFEIKDFKIFVKLIADILVKNAKAYLQRN